jgi:hypothetical protein
MAAFQPFLIIGIAALLIEFGPVIGCANGDLQILFGKRPMQLVRANFYQGDYGLEGFLQDRIGIDIQNNQLVRVRSLNFIQVRFGLITFRAIAPDI